MRQQRAIAFSLAMLYNKKYLQRMIFPVSMQHPSLTRFEPATTLDEIHLTISPEPLLTQKEIDAFYREEMNCRGSNF